MLRSFDLAGGGQALIERRWVAAVLTHPDGGCIVRIVGGKDEIHVAEHIGDVLEAFDPDNREPLN